MNISDKTYQVDLLSSFKILKKNKGTIVLFLGLGLILFFLSVGWSKIEYRASSVITLKKENSGSSVGSLGLIGDMSSALSVIPSFSSLASKTDLPAKIMGETFLSSLIEDEEFKKEIIANGICQYGDPSIFSLAGILNKLNLYGPKK